MTPATPTPTTPWWHAAGWLLFAAAGIWLLGEFA